MRNLKAPLKWIVGVWSALIALFYLYTAVFGIMQPRIQRGVHMLFLLPMAFLLFPATKKNSPVDRPSALDWVLALASIVPALYIIIYNEPLNMRMQMVSSMDTLQVVLGTINILLIIEAIRRVVVPAMAILVAVFLLYVFVAPYLPGILYSRPLRFPRLVEMNYLLTDTGIYGGITGVTATFVAIFVIFGSFMETTKTGAFFTNFATKVAGRGPGGPAKIAVVSSGLFGSISGVASANVYATGTFTIPLMKKLGYRPQFAGAVEAAASTGGLIMPPIMGAGAFVMSEITNIPYATIALAAALGAVLYYVSIYWRVHFVALKDNLKAMDPKDMISWEQVFFDSYLLLPLVVLIAFLVIGYSPFGACTYAIGTSFLLSFLRKDTRLSPKKLFEIFEKSGYNCIMLGVTCAGAGMVVSVVTYTGLALGIATAIQSFSGGFLLPALILVMITCLILGMGLPCTPAYIIAVTIGGPAMMALGIPTLPAHLFVFYFAIMAEVTPPVCIASYCGAAIAGTKPLATGVESSLIAIMGYLIPFIFVYNPALILRGTPLDIIATFLLGVIISGLWAATFSGYLFKHLNIIVRILLGLVTAGLVVLVCNVKIMGQLLPQIAIIVVGVAAIALFLTVNRKTVKALKAEVA
ncbi:MAG: TRAP transporter fused permease subunit [Spirochaetales bacterium]|jgi:TRAP transporter 4TM/12TM fusion protein|uniref:TRAP transporter, 4TM/12TM fusion protein n=1 Tax=uncultured Spirochaetota bacterium TaxID=460511 RepID=A0A652ZXI8_9SPIR|nr:TRAP transporter fused permease subunit [Spirochaetales bacterium]NLX44900.1 TRAP transporter fused permease subunit [Treponema sp.]VBB40528.1 TRAP transporter, 4TM/12TM fusion protein [uncultured Spirochaetota bacterium]